MRYEWFLLDTNVASELRKKERCAPRVNAWAATVPRNQDFLSVLVVGELVRGATLKHRTDPQMADALERAGKQFELMMYPQKAHGVTGPFRKQMLEGLTQFFEKNLK